MPAALYRQFDVGQQRGDGRYEQGNENSQSKAIVEKSNQLLLLEMMAADWLAFAVDREIPLWSSLATH
jgi:hypothetical protein